MLRKRSSSLPGPTTRRASVQSKVSGPRRPRAGSYNSRTRRKSHDPSKFTQIIVGNSPQEHSPSIFKGPDPKGYTNVYVPNHIKAEDIESYQQTEYISYLAREITKKHLNEYIKNNPNSTYEEWMRNLHSVNVKKGKYGRRRLDPRFYLPNAENLRYWKNVQKELHADNWAIVYKDNSI
jgi:ribosomal protein L32E